MSIRNLDALFEPRSIALIGASNRAGSVGAVLARNLFGSGFNGPVMPVNPRETSIRSVVCYPSLDALPMVPDLALIATPAAGVPALVADLGQRGCRAAVVISSGFDAAGRRALLEAARPHLLRVVGPNCLGVLSPPSSLNASFAHLTPRKGDLAFVSQSAAMATTVLDWADVREIGFSHVVATGDMSDVDIGDLLDHLALDARARAILLYIETITDARKFMTAARIAARTKPVVVIKAGRNAGLQAELRPEIGGGRGADDVYDAAFRRAGMLRVETLRELFEAVATLATGLRPSGDRLAILTNSDAAGTLALDALSAFGGRLARFSDGVWERLRPVLPGSPSPLGLVKLAPDASASAYSDALAAILEAGDQDAVLVMNCPQAITDGTQAAHATVEGARKARRTPVLTCWLGERAARTARRVFAASNVPTYQTPDETVRAFTQLVTYRRNQDLLMQTPAVVAPFGVDREVVERLVGGALAEGRTALSEPESKALLAAYGIASVPTEIAADPAEAATLAGRIGFPVALKILSPDIAHKSDVGGVRLQLDDAAMVREAAEHMIRTVAERQPGARIEGFTVQAMIRRANAIELRLGISTDPVFGPIIRFGQGGTASDILDDRAVGLPPLNAVLARDMIDRTKVSRLLVGYSDRPPADLEVVVATLVTLSRMAADLEAVAELDINPLLADSDGVLALDARVVLREGAGAGEARFAILPYPEDLETEVASRKARFRLRPIRPEDEPALVRMVEASDPEDVRLRFFAPMRRIGHAFAARLTQIDYSREMALVAEDAAAGEPGTILGVVRLIADPDGERAEFGIMVRSDQKGRGLGRILMDAILGYARGQGMRTVYGEVLAENAAMLAMARRIGFRQKVHAEDPGLRILEYELSANVS
ncbi:bifunctional acetate--CoA ligase family protein/GNAT family N-acetyltransferase [uncultured Aureimonas sp.]|uniref:bifunctional acetate--CoA ligase family protein/GNAT family N-acetyltransferase n=1 Tax=uncultured Aureimonas sp. TaxID=1604662 RepID=UPI0025EF67FB|nr:bifunctional acetate--CoA ligase family protein/GNAT family N-acetyltransferase [uncultured Aureimonas sp.]